MPNLMPTYPTADQILENPPRHKPAVIKAVKTWKKNVWREAKGLDEETRFNALSGLLQTIASIYEKPVHVTGPLTEIGSAYYNSETQTVTMNSPVSIVTGLHELAHHLFGPSETKACRWSVHLFKKCFPTAFSRLRFEGHLLVRARPIGTEPPLSSLMRRLGLAPDSAS